MEKLETAVEAHGLHAIFEEPGTMRRHRVDLLPGMVPPSAVSGTLAYVLSDEVVCFGTRESGCPLSGSPHALVELKANTFAVCCPVMLADVLGIKIKGINK